jgi:MFS family permease
MAFSTVPTPLYPIYQRQDGFTSFTVTVIFAVYAVGVVTSLLLAGHISDWVGRKRVLLPALGLEAVAAVLFLAWPALPGLLIARFITGLGVGMITATATAYLLELHLAHRPDAGRGRFEVISAAANLGGLGAGTLLAGALAQFVDAPLRTPYVVFLVLLALSAVAVQATPETVIAPHPRPRYRPQRIRVAAENRIGYAVAAAGAFAAFAVFGMFTSLAPSFVAGSLHHPGRLLAGAIVFLVLGAAAATQAVSGRLTARQRVSGADRAGARFGCGHAGAAGDHGGVVVQRSAAGAARHDRPGRPRPPLGHVSTLTTNSCPAAGTGPPARRSPQR